MVANRPDRQRPVVATCELSQRGAGIELTGFVTGDDVRAVVVDPELVALPGQRGVDALRGDTVRGEPIADFDDARMR
jgi:hypothetical protein